MAGLSLADLGRGAVDYATEFVRGPRDALAGRYSPQTQTPGTLTEEDQFRMNNSSDRAVAQALRMASWGLAPTGGGMAARMVPESIPGAIATYGGPTEPTLADLGSQPQAEQQGGVSLSDLVQAIMRNPQIQELLLKEMAAQKEQAPNTRVREGFEALNVGRPAP